MYKDKRDKINKNHDDIPKYRKKAVKKSAEKSNHKHEYEEVVLSINAPSSILYIFNKPVVYSTGLMCKICGKVKNYSWEDREKSRKLYGLKTDDDVHKEFPNIKIIKYKY